MGGSASVCFEMHAVRKYDIYGSYTDIIHKKF